MVYIPYTLEDLTANQYSLYTVNSTIGQYGVGTFYASEAMQIPEGVTAYVANGEIRMDGADEDGNATGVLSLTQLEEGIIPAKTGVLIYGKAGDYHFIPSISYGTAVEGNMLVGFEADNNNPQSYAVVGDYATAYTLMTNKENAPIFSKQDQEFMVYNNNAYLKTPTDEGIKILSIKGGGTTEIENSEIRNENSKMIYDLQGRRVENPAKGLYIVNGQKKLL